MTTIEKLLVQIFERKQWIIEQAKHQTHLFDQHLASKLIIDGFAPPPWLWTHPLHSQTSDPKHFNKEELISGVLFPRPQPVIPYSSSHCSLYNKPVAADNEELPNGLCTEVYTFNKGFDARDGPPFLPECPVSDAGCASNGVPELDPSATSPQDPRGTGISDIYLEPALSLSKIQRSKSRQRALELRNSVKTSKRCSTDENKDDAYAGRISGSAIASLQSDPVDESVLVNPVDTINECCTVEEVNIGDCQSKENNSNIYSGRMTRSRSSSQQPRSLIVGSSSYIATESISKLREQPSHENVQLELVKSSCITNESCGGSEAKRGDDRNKQMGSNVYLGRIKISRSSSKQPSYMNKLSEMVSSSDNDKEDDVSVSKQHSNHVDESAELVKPSALTDDSDGMKEKVDCHSKEQRSNAYCGRILRSRSSCQPFNKVNGSTQAQSVGKSMQLFQSPSWNGEDAEIQNGKGPQMYVVRSSSSQKFQELCGANAKENSEEGYVTRNSGAQAINSIETISKVIHSNISGGRVTRSRFAVSSKSHKAQGTQISAERSLPSQKDLEPCTVNAKEMDKENIADEYAGRNSKADTTSTIEGTSKPVNSSLVLGCRITRSRSTASNKPPLARSLIRFEGIDLQEVSGTQAKVVPCINTSDIVDLDRCAATVLETRTESDGLVGSHSVCSGSNLDGASLKVGLEVLASRPLFDCSMFVKAKQLNFDDVEQPSLNQISSPALWGRSSEKKCLTLSGPADLLDTVTSANYQVMHHSPLEKPLLEDQEDLSKEEESPRCSSEAHVEETTDKASRTSNENTVIETSGAPKDAVTHTSLESDTVPKQKSSLMDHSTTVQIACADSLGSPVKDVMVSNPLNGNDDTRMDLSFEKAIGEFDAAKPTKLDSDLLGDPKPSMDAVFSVVTGSGHFRNPDVTLRDSMIKLPCAVLVDEGKGNLVQLIMNSGISEYQNANCLGRRISKDKNEGCSRSIELPIANNAIPRSFSSGLEDSWPQHKRRKTESQLTNLLSPSPSLREERIISRDSMSQNLNVTEDQKKNILESEHFSITHEGYVPQSNISKSPVEEMHQNEEHQMIEGSESSPGLQVEESGLSSKGRDTSADTPFTFMDEEFRASFFSSLINQADGDSQGSLVEGAEVADPSSINFDARMQSNIEENQVPLNLEDPEGLGTEHLTCTERTMQKKGSHLEGNGKYSYCSVGSPHSQSFDFVGADETMPMFEGFILPTNGKHPCIAGEGISFDKSDLPNSTIDHASVLEQLCRSASMQTPSSCSSSMYKLHRVPNLYQSVPNGLLEGIDLRSTFPMNDTGEQPYSSCFSKEIDRAFHGRSHSDCLPNSSGQYGWDIRKPYTSPVGKLWDRITSNSGSSEKQAILNPELPCINEENENVDEVADTFVEGIGSEVMTNSVERVPLADITESPTLPASVCEVEIHADRLSLDSVNTEFSFNGTHTRVKKKLGNQNSSKRRYTNKAKEKQSISLEANGVKRAESFHNRFSKPKLSGKTSMRNGGPSFSERESKPNNIVANIASFIPLVQQKQAAAVVTGKRDIKVKALEAAEAAKRLAEKKENERKMKKEALKLERARLEQENLRQLELQKKRKKEEHKKKEADMAAKKRQREEEERKEKERKRKRVEEGWRQQREQEEKLRGEKEEKELKRQATDARAHEMKQSKDETEKHKNMEKERGGDNLGHVSETEPKALKDCGDNLKVMSNLDKAVEDDNLFVNTYQERSYEISPYKVSDDEDEEEDDVPNSKFIPSWVSKHSLAVVVLSQQRVDPEVIFPPDSFCNIAEVLLPRKHQLK